jgi:hypothetical protein
MKFGRWLENRNNKQIKESSNELAREADIFKRTCNSLGLDWRLDGTELVIMADFAQGYGERFNTAQDIVRAAELVLKEVPGGQIVPPSQLSLSMSSRHPKGNFSVRKVGISDDFIVELVKGEDMSRFIGGRVPLVVKNSFGDSQKEDPSLNLKINKARELAKQQNISYAVVSMDSGEGRTTRVVPEEYLDDEEFHAFSGKVIRVVNPDGSMA